MAFAVLLAPLTEEIAFRGFLLPALATAYDWLALERTPAGLERWQRSSLHSASALLFSAIFSSIPFALLHADQLSHAWGVLGSTVRRQPGAQLCAHPDALGRLLDADACYVQLFDFCGHLNLDGWISASGEAEPLMLFVESSKAT